MLSNKEIIDKYIQKNNFLLSTFAIEGVLELMSLAQMEALEAFTGAKRDQLFPNDK